MSLFDELDEVFLTEVYDKLIREINRSKTDSKDHHFQKLAYNLMKIAVKSNFSSLFQKGTNDLEALKPWVKAEGYRWLGDFLITVDSELYPASHYYNKSYNYWKDTLLNQQESLINLTGSALKLIRSLKMSHESDLLGAAVEDYPQFLEQLSIEHQPSQWLEYALCMVNVLPPSEINQLVAKAEDILQSEAARSKREFSLKRWLLEFELATIQKDVTALENLYDELMTNQSSDMDMGMIQPSGMVLSNENPMKYIAITFANAFWGINEPVKALKFLDDRLDVLHSSWNRYEKEGWPAGSAQKSLRLQELISICETYVEHDLHNKCEKIRTLLVQDYESDEEIHPLRRINLLVSLGWYSEELLSVCETVCPMRAIHKDENTGALLIDYDLCVGCKLCVTFCPFGGAGMDIEGKVIKCDLCKGDPQCVKNCEPEALQYLEASAINLRKRRVAAENLSELMKKLLTITS